MAKKIPDLRNLLYVFLGLICLVSLSFAWFVSSNEANLNNMTFKATEGVNIEISIDGVNYSNEPITLPGENLSIMDISGSGLKVGSNVQLFVPEKDDDGEPIAEGDGWKTSYAVKDVDYLEYDVYFRTSVECDLYFTGDSFLSPVDVTQRINGDFAGGVSADYIAGAVRVSFCKVNPQNGAETLKLVWMPNPTYELSYDGGSEEWSLDEDGTPESPTQYYDGTALVNTTDVFSSDLSVAKLMTAMDKNSETGYYEAHLRIRIWCEGTDRETKSVLEGGLFNAEFSFDILTDGE